MNSARKPTKPTMSASIVSANKISIKRKNNKTKKARVTEKSEKCKPILGSVTKKKTCKLKLYYFVLQFTVLVVSISITLPIVGDMKIGP